MHKLSVMGDLESVLGFKALGFDTYATETADEARDILHKLADANCAVIYITEQVASMIMSDIDKYKDLATPAIILIPGKEGTMGIGMKNLHAAVERAVGANILGE